MNTPVPEPSNNPTLTSATPPSTPQLNQASAPPLTDSPAPKTFWNWWGPGAAIIIAFGFVGALTGDLVGSSQSPVVSTVIPLVVGLLAALTYGLIDTKSPWQKLAESLKEPLSEGKVSIEDFLALKANDKSQVSLQLAGFWALAVVCFCCSCWFGIDAGVNRRAPRPPSLTKLLGDTQPTIEERVALVALRQHLISLNTSSDEIADIFKTIIVPVLHEENTTTVVPNGHKETPRFEKLARICGKITEQSQRQRIPAPVMPGDAPKKT